MNLTVVMESAEFKFKQILEEFFITAYDEKFLSSHGIDHHRRVWTYAKQLLIPYADLNPQFITQLPSKLIIASYLHDIGMSVNQGAKHGKESRNLCMQFLTINNLPEKEYSDVLEAIEYHDNKDYESNTIVNDLLTILSVADDLDAFGCNGIYRYSEIYLTRKIEFDKIGHRIRENARIRYDNFIKIFGSIDELVMKHWERYYLLDMFFTKYNEQLPYYQFGTTSPSGFCGVIEIFKLMMEKNIQVTEVCSEPEKYSDDPLIKWYFAELNKEISGFENPLTAKLSKI
jgi:hypothetical protein